MIKYYVIQSLINSGFYSERKNGFSGIIYTKPFFYKKDAENFIKENQDKDFKKHPVTIVEVY